MVRSRPVPATMTRAPSHLCANSPRKVELVGHNGPNQSCALVFPRRRDLQRSNAAGDQPAVVVDGEPTVVVVDAGVPAAQLFTASLVPEGTPFQVPAGSDFSLLFSVVKSAIDI